MATRLKSVLISPPLTDPTAPYHSLAYLAGFARSRGYDDIEIVDANVEALCFCARPEHVEARLQAWAARRAALAAQPGLTPLEQLEYSSLTRAHVLEPSGPGDAIDVMRDPEAFYDYARYRDAARTLGLWVECLSNDGYPAQFSRRLLISQESLFSLSSTRDLCDPQVLGRIAQPLAPYFEAKLFPAIAAKKPEVIGVTIGYVSQLPYALWMIQRLRELSPTSYLICGGTEVSDLWKYLEDRGRFAEIFRSADACVIGEGETTFVEILDALAEHRRPAGLDNLIDVRAGQAAAPRIRYEDLNALPTPAWDLMPTSSYFSPHPLVFYSPTRGCYWNKCTFCDYGLNFGSPTSPWRQRSIDLILEDLRAAAKAARFVYLSVDVLAPGALTRLAQAIVDEGIEIAWAAEIRLERFFSPERCDLLKQSGCVAVSVGFEAGEQRILDAIDKGTNLEVIGQTIRNFSDAGVAVQLMGFTDFPSETLDEALQSIAYVDRHRDWWTVAGLGQFQLTPGAIVAQRPTAFGVANARSPDGADIRRALIYDETFGGKTREERDQVEAAKAKVITVEFDRPFAGGIDCPHSIFYYDRYGLRFPRQVTDGATPMAADAPVSLGGVLIEDERFDLNALFDRDHLEALHLRLRRSGRMPPSVDLEQLVAGQAPDAEPVSAFNPCFVRRDGAVIPCSEEMWEILRRANGSRTLRDILEELEPSEREVGAYAQFAGLLLKHEMLTGAGPPNATPKKNAEAPSDRATKASAPVFSG